MDGYIANLKGICDLADEFDALVMVDDSHAVGFMGDKRARHTGILRCHGQDIITGIASLRSPDSAKGCDNMAISHHI